MGYTTHQKQNAGRGFIAWLLLCGTLFAALTPVRAAALSTSDTSPAANPPSQTLCRMASTPEPCCCPAGHGTKTATRNSSTTASVQQGACSCSVRPAPAVPRGNSEPAALVNTATPLFGVVPATLPIANIAPRFAQINALRPAFLLGPPLRSPPRSADNGRAPPAFLS